MKLKIVTTNCKYFFFIPATNVLFHAKSGQRRLGEPQGTQGMSDLRKDAVRPVNLQSTHENSHGLQAFHLRVLWKGFPSEGKLQKPPTDPFG